MPLAEEIGRVCEEEVMPLGEEIGRVREEEESAW